MLLQGIFVPLSTPFYRDGQAYWRKLEANAARFSLTPAAGLVALPPGTAGSASLTDAECAETLRIVSASARPEKVLLAGIERASVAAALELATQAAAAGFDAILAAPPLGGPRLARDGSQTFQLFFEALADRSPLPVVLWSSPAVAGSALPVELVSSLAAHPNLIGLADEALTPERLAAIRDRTSSISREVTVTTVFEAVTARMLRTQEPVAAVGGFVSAESLAGGAATAVAAPTLVASQPAIKTRTKTVGFQLMAAGGAAALATLMEQGVSAFLPTLAGCAPQAVHEAYAAMKDGDPALAQLKTERLVAADALLAELGDAGVRYAADFNAYFGGQPRLPLVPLSAEERARVEAAFREIRN